MEDELRIAIEKYARIHKIDRTAAIKGMCRKILGLGAEKPRGPGGRARRGREKEGRKMIFLLTGAWHHHKGFHMNAKSIGLWMEEKLAAALDRAARAAGCSRAESVRRCCVLFLSQGAMRPGSRRRSGAGRAAGAAPPGRTPGAGVRRDAFF